MAFRRATTRSDRSEQPGREASLGAPDAQLQLVDASLHQDVRLRLREATQLQEVVLCDHVVEADRLGPAAANRSERIAQANVDGEVSVLDAPRQRSIVDDIPPVELLEPAVAVSVVREAVDAG